MHESKGQHILLYTRGMQSIVGEREGYGAFVFHIHFFPLAYISCNNSLIPRSSPPPTVACQTTGGECLGKRLYRISN